MRAYIMEGHDWEHTLVPNGHDPVPGWRCRNCGEEVIERHNMPQPSDRFLVHRWDDCLGTLAMTCEEFMAFEVMGS